MKEVLNKLVNHQTLSRNESKEALINLASGQINKSHIVAFITVYMMRNITLPELEGFRDALLELCLKIDFSEFETIDVCGTGGDGKDTFNISTLSAFVLAGAGIKVAKHGNYGASSICGSSNVMEYLGYLFTKNEDTLKGQLDKAGVCILHAPLFHPALKEVADARKELGVKTFFNMLGPLVNPSFPKYKFIGVNNLELHRIYNYILQKDSGSYSIVHSIDGYDEISLTGAFRVSDRNQELLIDPLSIGFSRINPTQILGGKSIKEAAKIFINVLSGNGTVEQNAVLIVNSAYAIQCAEKSSIEECLEKAKESLHSKKAFQLFNTLISNQ